MDVMALSSRPVGGGLACWDFERAPEERTPSEKARMPVRRRKMKAAFAAAMD